MDATGTMRVMVRWDVSYKKVRQGPECPGSVSLFGKLGLPT